MIEWASHTCGICQKTIKVRSPNIRIEGAQKIGGRPWDPIFACLGHTQFEIEVWKVKTNRRSVEHESRYRSKRCSDISKG